MGFRLQRFCCCCNLRTGSLIIGTAGWVLTFIELFYLSGSLFSPPSRTYEFHDGDISFDETLGRLHRRDLITKIGYGIVSLIICVLLVVGIYKRDKRFMLPWLVLKCFEGMILILGIVIFFFIACFSHHQYQILFFILSFMLVVVSGITWYTWLCVYSHYREIGEGVPQDGIPEVYYSPPPAMDAPAYPDKAQLDFSNPPDYNQAVAPPAYQEKSQFSMA